MMVAPVGVTSVVAGFVAYVLWQMRAWKQLREEKKEKKKSG